MNLRKSCLPPGWYPQNPSKINEFLGSFSHLPNSEQEKRILAAVAPHAGWYYSGNIAAQAVSALSASPAETVAVIGGHLPESMPALFAMEDAVSTPLGNLELDGILRNALVSSFRDIGFASAEDRYQDNTVEVLLPMVTYFFPEAKLLWLRLPAQSASFEAGKILAKTAASIQRNLVVLGSTDLTHYGVNYAFSPKGCGKDALDWVKKVNDRRFIDAVETGNPDAVLDRAGEERSSCSAGAVLGVMGFAEETRRSQQAASNSAGKLLAYSTSADVVMNEGEPVPDSFVGYGGFIWSM